MPTYYKPTQMRGKRVVYKSMDPDEPKRETRIGLVFLGFFFVFLIFVSFFLG